MKTLTNPPQAAIATAAAANAETAVPKMTVWDTGSTAFIYIRTAWDATYDHVLKIGRVAGASTPNFNFLENGLVAIATASGGTPTITSIQSISDDTTGYSTTVNGRIGGNHIAQICAVTKAAHGITAADIGKRFTDSSARYWVITDYVSSSVFWMCPQATLSVSGDSTGTLFLPTAATDLTGLDGLSNITGATYAYTTTGPIIQGLVQQFYCDGKPLIPGARPVSCEKLEVVEYSLAPNLKGAYAYFTTTGSSATWAGAGSMWARTTKTVFHGHRQIEIEDSFTTVYTTRFSEANPCQFNPLLGLTGAANLFMWMPGADSITATGKTVNGVASPTLDLNVPTYWGSGSGGNIEWNTLGDSIMSVFPDFFIQLGAPASGTHAGWTSSQFVALDCTYADGSQANRPNNTKEFCNISPSTRKTYFPGCVSLDSGIAAGTTFAFRALRRWDPAPASSPVDFWTFVKAGEKWLVYAAWTTNPGSFTLTLPGYLRDKVATLVRGHNATLTSTSSVGGSLVIASTAANGHAIIQLG